MSYSGDDFGSFYTPDEYSAAQADGGSWLQSLYDGGAGYNAFAPGAGYGSTPDWMTGLTSLARIGTGVYGDITHMNATPGYYPPGSSSGYGLTTAPGSTGEPGAEGTPASGTPFDWSQLTTPGSPYFLVTVAGGAILAIMLFKAMSRR